MVEEYSSILKNDVSDVVPRPKVKSMVSSKWIYKIKQAADDKIGKSKVRSLAQGFSQQEGVHYELLPNILILELFYLLPHKWDGGYIKWT